MPTSAATSASSTSASMVSNNRLYSREQDREIIRIDLSRNTRIYLSLPRMGHVRMVDDKTRSSKEEENASFTIPDALRGFSLIKKHEYFVNLLE